MAAAGCPSHSRPRRRLSSDSTGKRDMISIMFAGGHPWLESRRKEKLMIRALAMFVWLVPSIALAQSAPQHPANDGTAEQMMHHRAAGASAPTQPGQAAFAAIQEI